LDTSSYGKPRSKIAGSTDAGVWSQWSEIAACGTKYLLYICRRVNKFQLFKRCVPGFYFYEALGEVVVEHSINASQTIGTFRVNQPWFMLQVPFIPNNTNNERHNLPHSFVTACTRAISTIVMNIQVAFQERPALSIQGKRMSIRGIKEYVQ
jgi:hypothetical protein